MPKINKNKILAFIFIIEAIISLSFFNLYADTSPKPQRPYYSETPTKRHIANNDRLTAQYFNNQLNVIYNWAQNINQELDDLLHNGRGVASLTVGILTATQKIINPEWDALLHNGQGVASLTANLITAKNLDVLTSLLVPSIQFKGSSQPNVSNVQDGYLYFDTGLKRFRVYQQGKWRDLSNNFVIEGNTLTNPLIVNGYMEVYEIKVEDNATFTKNITVQGDSTLNSVKATTALKVPTVADKKLGQGSVYYDTATGKLKVLNSSNQWEIVGEVSQSYVDDKIQEAKDYATEQDTATLQYLTAFASGNLEEAKNYASQQATNALNSSKSYADTQANNALNSSKSYSAGLASSTKDAAEAFTRAFSAPMNHNHDSSYISSISTGDSNGQIKVTKNGTATNVSVKGLGSAAYTASTAYATSNHNHNSSYVSAVAQGSSNGTIAVTKNGTTSDVSVKGLGSAAYTASTAYATSNHNHNSSYVSAVATGDNNGTIKVTKNGSSSNVAVKGLGSAAYTASTAYATASHNHDSAYAAKNHTHTIDSAMSDSSTNPVQNKVIKAYIDSQISSAISQAKAYTDSTVQGDYQITDSNGSGYMKFSNGVIVQWIKKANVQMNGEATVHLPTSFTTSDYVVTTGFSSGSDDTVYTTSHQACVYGRATDSFLVCINNHTGANWGGYCDFIAIGK